MRRTAGKRYILNCSALNPQPLTSHKKPAISRYLIYPSARTKVRLPPKSLSNLLEPSAPRTPHISTLPASLFREPNRQTKAQLPRVDENPSTGTVLFTRPRRPHARTAATARPEKKNKKPVLNTGCVDDLILPSLWPPRLELESGKIQRAAKENEPATIGEQGKIECACTTSQKKVSSPMRQNIP